jgi:hypothetical protein
MELAITIHEGEPRVSSRGLAALMGWETQRLEKVIRHKERYFLGLGALPRNGLVTLLNRAQAEHLVEVSQVPQAKEALEVAFGKTQPPITSPFDPLRREDERGEYWMARDLMGPLGYTKWQNLEEAIERAEAACRNSRNTVEEHFLLVSVKMPEGPGRPSTNYRLTRYACYLVAMNGDPRKPEIAHAQTYFAVQTRRAELEQPALPEDPMEILELTFKALREQRARVAVLESKTQALENTTQQIDRRTQSLHFRPDLALSVRNHIGQLCRVSGKSFSEAYRDLYNKFQVNEYKALTVEQYPAVIQYLSSLIAEHEVQGRLV